MISLAWDGVFLVQNYFQMNAIFRWVIFSEEGPINSHRLGRGVRPLLEIVSIQKMNQSVTGMANENTKDAFVTCSFVRRR